MSLHLLVGTDFLLMKNIVLVPSTRHGMPCDSHPIYLAYGFRYKGRYLWSFVRFRYSMSYHVSSSSMALIISFGNFCCANCAGVNVSCALFTETNMASWVGYLIYPVWIRVLWVGASTSSSILLLWAASWGDRRIVSGSSDVWGVTTLVGGTTIIGIIFGGGTVL